MGNTLLGGGTPEAPAEDQEAGMERMPSEVDTQLRGFSDEELEQALARRRGTAKVYETWMYHAEIAPEGKLTTSDKIEQLEADGWVDTPAKFNQPKEEVKDGERDERLHELSGQGGQEADGPDPDPEGTDLRDVSEEGLSEAAGQGGGVLRPDDEGKQEVDEADDEDMEKRKENIYAAFAALIEEGDDDKFDANGQPHLDRVNDLLGFPVGDPRRVKATERNRRWEVYRENLKKEVNKAD
jgi:hypothetical protein